MKAITVRQSGILVCFGPENGMYDPVVPSGSIRMIEASYSAVLEEWIAAHPPGSDRRVQILDNPNVPQWFKDYIR